MQVRHLVARENVGDDGCVIDPLSVRHGTLRAGHVWALAGPIDAPTHLNLDFGEHRLDLCVVVEALEVGAAVVPGADPPPASAYLLATASPAARAHLGAVDFGARRAAWLTALRERRISTSAGGGVDVRPTPHRAVTSPVGRPLDGPYSGAVRVAVSVEDRGGGAL